MSTSAGPFPVGDRRTLTWTFVDASAMVEDPAEVTVEYRDSRGTPTSLTYTHGDLTRVSTGVYSVAITFTYSGSWYFRAYSPDGAARAMAPDLLVTIDPTRAA